MKPVIFGLSGDRVTDEERAFFRDVDPAGYILFKRNIVDRAQLRASSNDPRPSYRDPSWPRSCWYTGAKRPALRMPSSVSARAAAILPVFT